MHSKLLVVTLERRQLYLLVEEGFQIFASENLIGFLVEGNKFEKAIKLCNIICLMAVSN